VLGHARRRVTGFVAPRGDGASPTSARVRPSLRRVLLGCGLFVVTFMLASGLLIALTLLWPGLYPGVRVGGVELDGADRAAVAARVAAAATAWEEAPLTISGPAGTLATSRQALGFRYDRDATLTAALATGHTGPLPARLGTIFELWWQGRDLPVSYTVDEATLNARIGEMAGATDVQPRDGALQIVDGRVVVTPAIEGRGLDQAAARELLHVAAVSGATAVTLPVSEGIQPAIDAATLAAAQERAEGLLAAPLTLRGEGLDHRFEPTTIGSWLLVQQGSGQAEPLTVTVDPARVRAALAGFAPAMRRDTQNAAYAYDERQRAFVVTNPALDGRQLNLDGTVAAAIAALDSADARTVVPVTDRWRPGLSDGDIAAANGLAARSYLSGPLLYSWGGQRWLVGVPQLAGWLSIAPGLTPGAGPRLVFDEKALSAYLGTLGGQIDRAAIDATYTMDDGSDTYRLTGASQVGRALDGDAALKATLAALHEGKAVRALSLTVRETRPKVTEADVAALQPEHWVDVDLTSQRMNAVVGKKVIYTATISSGKKGWETPTGTYHIMYRVENETMTSESIGAEDYYRLENVLYTQYFTNEGHALHYSWWKTPESFGTPSSHGCVSETLKDAEYFWNFADVGTRVTIRGVSPT
jgi:lipoprotein-anchoring transpeptidase ErfK/SrfK